MNIGPDPHGPLLCPPHRFNRLSAHSVKESSFKHLTNLQVLDIGHSSHSNPSGASFRQEEEEEEEMEMMEEEVGEGFTS